MSFQPSGILGNISSAISNVISNLQTKLTDVVPKQVDITKLLTSSPVNAVASGLSTLSSNLISGIENVIKLPSDIVNMITQPFQVLPNLSSQQQQQFVQTVNQLPTFGTTPTAPLKQAVTQAETQAIQQQPITTTTTPISFMKQTAEQLPETVTKEVTQTIIVPATQAVTKTAQEVAKGAIEGLNLNLDLSNLFKLDENTKKLLLIGGVAVGGLVIYSLIKD